jgi:predicted metalloprotease with PDZ domain
MLKKILFLFFFTAGSLSAQQLNYKVDLNSTQTHKVKVEISLFKMGASKVTYQMPIWAPGAYSVTHYGHYVSDFKAFDTKGKSLKVDQVNGDRWEISDAKNIAKITYFVGDSHKDSTSLFFALANIDTNFFFANGTCLFGYVNDKKNIPSLINYNFPKEWKLATALDASFPEKFYDGAHPDFKLTMFRAKNYDELADAPVIAGTGFQTRTFKDGKAWYDIVVASDKQFPMDSLEENTHKIVHAETEFFHDTPFDHYSFLIYAPTYSKLFSNGEGALEHANSSAYLLVNLPWNIFKQFGPAIISHEFFHLWNVKRIHSSLLGPFDYTKRVMTTSLWLSEGITDYYAHTILTRWNILPYRSFETVLSELIRAVKDSKAAQTKNLEELSIAESDFDLTNALVFYSKGTLVGLMLDIEIRSRTNNKKSLDEVMLALNAEAKKGKTFKDKELIGKIEKLSGLNLQSFYKKYIAGTDTLPIDEYLKKMGVGRNVATSNEEKVTMGGTLTMTETGEMIFEKVFSGGALDKAGVLANDTIKTLNGEPFTMEKGMELVEHIKPPVTIDFDIARPSGLKHLTVTLDKPRARESHVTKDFAPLPDATPLEIEIRHGIVGKDY